MKLNLEFNLLGIVALYVVALISAFAHPACGIVAFACITLFLIYALYLSVKGEKEER